MAAYPLAPGERLPGKKAFSQYNVHPCAAFHFGSDRVSRCGVEADDKELLYVGHGSMRKCTLRDLRRTSLCSRSVNGIPFSTVTKKASLHRCVRVLHGYGMMALYERVVRMERRKGIDLWLLWMDT